MKNILKKVANVPVSAGKGAFNFVDSKMTESLIRSDSRFRYYNQFQSEELEKLHKRGYEEKRR